MHSIKFNKTGYSNFLSMIPFYEVINQILELQEIHY